MNHWRVIVAALLLAIGLGQCVPMLVQGAEPVMRDSNPCALRYDRRNDWRGGGRNGFISVPYGVRACALTLKTYHDAGIRTVAGIVDRWAPPVENDTTAFSVFVASYLGVTIDEVLPWDYPTVEALVRAIVAFENHGRRPSKAELALGLRMAGVRE